MDTKPNQTAVQFLANQSYKDVWVAGYWELFVFPSDLIGFWWNHSIAALFHIMCLSHCERCVSAVVAIRDQPCRSMCPMSICTFLHLYMCAFVQLCICALMCLPICTFVLVWYAYVCFCWSMQVHIFDKVETPVTLLPQTTCGANESDGDSGDVHCPWQWWPRWW